MDAIREFTGTAVPLARSDVDTDQIIPSDWLKRVERTGFGAGLFSEWREDPEFVLNKPEFSGATILLAGPNFGTGSSREHAVWALTDYGFKAVISSRFGDIFRNNATKSGLIPVVLEQTDIEMLMETVDTSPNIEITVDVEHLTVTVPALGFARIFELDPFTQHRILNGLDDIGLTLQHEGELVAFEATRPRWKPSTSA